MNNAKEKELLAQHTKQGIVARLAAATQHSYLGDALLGAMDGTVTTFAVISGVAGAGLRSEIAIVLGLANLLADAFSMAAGNFLRAKADKQVVEQARKMEEEHIDLVPEGEREEIRQIFIAKGFSGATLEEIVKVITADRKRWVDTMIIEELGLRLETPHPMRAALATFAAFCIAGCVPLLPFVATLHLTSTKVFVSSAIVTALTFFTVGLFKGRVLSQRPFLHGMETLFVGGVAATLAYTIGLLTKHLLVS